MFFTQSFIQGDRWTPYSSSSMFFTQSLIQGDRWTSILKLKYVLYYVPQTGRQVGLHTQAQVCSLLSPSYRGTGGPPYSSSSMFFTRSLIQGDRWTSILKLKYVLYSVPHTGGQVDLHTRALLCSYTFITQRNFIKRKRGTSFLPLKYAFYLVLHTVEGGPPFSSSSKRSYMFYLTPIVGYSTPYSYE
jgi:hypothetical protein